MSFTHLHLHTEYSLLDGLPKIKDLVTTAKGLGFNSLALTDHGVMYGAIEFYKECLDAGIKPIIGMEAYVSKRDHTIKEKKGKYRDNNHLVLLAKNLTGYQNLMKLTSIAHLDGFYYKPRFDKKTLKKHSEGLICLSGCLLGEVAEYLDHDEYDKAKKTALWFADLFGTDHYYLEIQRHRYADFIDSAPDDHVRRELQANQARENKVNQGLLKLSKDLGLPLVATNDVHYIKPEQAAAQDALVCVQTGKDVADTNRMRYVDTPSFYLTTEKEMQSLFEDLPHAVQNSGKIADLCDIHIKLGDWFFPEFEIPGGKTAGEHLRDTAYEGAQKIFGKLDKTVKDRLDYELDVIETRGYSPYFLIVADMVNWCRDNGIVTTTRGSAAGALVLYATGITEVDPLKYQLPFERFLNPFRPSPPDIDLDIADNRRGDLIAHITSKYGAEKVAQICTFGRMLARASVRDIGRVLGFPYSFPDKIAKAIPEGSQGFPMTIKKALRVGKEFKKIYDENDDARRLIDMAIQIEGNARHTSVHAAAVVIAPSELTNFSPIQKESGGEKIVTQYEMHAAEDVGLIKFDVLGIRNLAILNSAIDIVEQSLDKKIDIKTIPLDDKKTFEMLSRGETMGTFQLGGTGMTRYLMELKPERVEDLMAMVALFRPGPMANIPEYIKRKNDPKRVTYMHPKMKNFLETSYGILVYQEDILFTALELAGYDWGTVDKLRKAIGKKIPEEMAKQEQIFVEGCIKHSGMTKAEAQKIWDLFVPFQGYGFNKAHAAAYGTVAYQTAYMKANFPVEFMTAVLTAEAENTDKVAQAIEECKRMDIPVLPPDINTSDMDFTIVPDDNPKYKKAIRFGLNAIKNVGAAAIENILEARDKEKEFGSLTHFIESVEGRKVNKKVIESLIKVGAMDAYGKRSSMLDALDSIRNTATRKQKQAGSGQTGLFDDTQSEVTIPKDDLPAKAEFNKTELLNFEKELLGIYLTDHPMADALKQISQDVTHKLSDLDPKIHNGYKVTLGGIIASLRPIYTKRGNKPMAFAVLEDETNKMDVVFFPNTWEEVKPKVTPDAPVLITGKLDLRDDQLNLVAEKVRPIESGSQTDQVVQHRLQIPRDTPKDTLQEIGKILKASPGDEKLAIDLPTSSGETRTIMLPYTVNFTPKVKKQVMALIGQTSS